MSNQFELLRELKSPEKVIEHARSRSSRLQDQASIPDYHANRTTGSVEWVRLWKTLRRRWRLTASFASAVVLGTMIFTVAMKPEYEATARMEVSPPGAEVFRGLDSGNSGGSDSEYVQTQAKVLESDELATSVIRQLRLAQNPEFKKSEWLSRTAERILQKRNQATDEGQRSTAPGIDAGGVPGLTPDESAVLITFQRRLKVNRDTSSRLIAVSFTSHDPVLSATIVNTLLNTFVDRTFQARHDAIMQSTEWLSRQIDDIRTRMEQSQQKLQQLQGEIGVSDIDSDRNTFTEQIADLSRQKTQAQGERIQLESYLARIKTGKGDTLPQVQANPTVQLLTQKLAESRTELSQASAIYGPNHPNSRKLQRQAEELETQINLQTQAILAQLETSYVAALSRETMVEREVRGTSRHMKEMSQYTTLKKEAEANSELYNALYAKVKEAGISAASKSSNLRIVDHARVLDRPTKPRPALNFSLSLLFGLTGGILLVFVREALDTSIHTTEDIYRWTGVSKVAILPLVTAVPYAALGRRTKLLSLIGNHPPGQSPKFLTDHPTSIQAEVMQGLYTSIMLSRPDRPPRAMLVASSLPNEGKTTVAINLALALAQHSSTCLVEADLRRPGISRSFNVLPPIGLSEYLRDSTSLDSILVPLSEVPNLTLLPAGGVTDHPGMLMTSAKMRDLVDLLRERYEFVVIDSSPLLPYADGRALAPLVDGVVFVGLAGAVTREEIVRSIELLQEVHSAPILEIVLNAAEMSSKDYSYYQRYS